MVLRFNRLAQPKHYFVFDHAESVAMDVMSDAVGTAK